MEKINFVEIQGIFRANSACTVEGFFGGTTHLLANHVVIGGQLFRAGDVVDVSVFASRVSCFYQAGKCVGHDEVRLFCGRIFREHLEDSTRLAADEHHIVLSEFQISSRILDLLGY